MSCLLFRVSACPVVSRLPPLNASGRCNYYLNEDTERCNLDWYQHNKCYRWEGLEWVQDLVHHFTSLHQCFSLLHLVHCHVASVTRKWVVSCRTKAFLLQLLQSPLIAASKWNGGGCGRWQRKTRVSWLVWVSTLVRHNNQTQLQKPWFNLLVMTSSCF
jgi:hypothetical protein